MAINFPRRKAFRGVESYDIVPRPILQRVPDTKSQQDPLTVFANTAIAIGNEFEKRGLRIRKRDFAIAEALETSRYFESIVKAERTIDINDPASGPQHIQNAGNLAIQEGVGRLSDRFGAKSPEVSKFASDRGVDLSKSVSRQTLVADKDLANQSENKIENFIAESLRKFGGTSLDTDVFSATHQSLMNMMDANSDKIPQETLLKMERGFLQDWEEKYYQGIASGTDYSLMKSILDIYDNPNYRQDMGDGKEDNILFLYTDKDSVLVNAIRSAYGDKDKNYNQAISDSISGWRDEVDNLKAAITLSNNSDADIRPNRSEPFPGENLVSDYLARIRDRRDTIISIMDKQSAILTDSNKDALTTVSKQLFALESVATLKLRALTEDTISGLKDAQQDYDNISDTNPDVAEYIVAYRNLLSTFIDKKKKSIFHHNNFISGNGNERDSDYIYGQTLLRQDASEFVQRYNIPPDVANLVFNAVGNSIRQVVEQNIVVDVTQQPSPDSRAPRQRKEGKALGWGFNYWRDMYLSTEFLDKRILKYAKSAFLENDEQKIAETGIKLVALSKMLNENNAIYQMDLTPHQEGILRQINSRGLRPENYEGLAKLVIAVNKNPNFFDEQINILSDSEHDDLLSNSMRDITKSIGIDPSSDARTSENIKNSVIFQYMGQRVAGRGVEDAMDAATSIVSERFGKARIGFGTPLSRINIIGLPEFFGGKRYAYSGVVVENPIDKITSTMTKKSVENALAMMVKQSIQHKDMTVDELHNDGVLGYISQDLRGRGFSIEQDSDGVPLHQIGNGVLNRYEVIKGDSTGFYLKVWVNTAKEREPVYVDGSDIRIGVPLTWTDPEGNETNIFKINFTDLEKKTDNNLMTEADIFLQNSLRAANRAANSLFAGSLDSRADMDGYVPNLQRPLPSLLKYKRPVSNDDVSLNDSDDLDKKAPSVGEPSDEDHLIDMGVEHPQFKSFIPPPPPLLTSSIDQIIENQISFPKELGLFKDLRNVNGMPLGNHNIFNLQAGKEWVGVSDKTGDHSNFVSPQLAWRSFFRLARNYLDDSNKNTIRGFITAYVGEKFINDKPWLIDDAVRRMPGVESADQILIANPQTLKDLSYMIILQEGAINSKDNNGITPSSFVVFLRDGPLVVHKSIIGFTKKLESKDFHSQYTQMIDRALENSKKSADNHHWIDSIPSVPQIPSVRPLSPSTAP